MLYNNTKFLDKNKKNFINYYDKFYKVKNPPRDKKGKLIVITSVNPTPKGEGKTTLLIGLVDAMNANGYQAIGCLRQPSLGPVFGMKGTATGGGESVLKDDAKINLGFTGDFDAITAANNLISTAIENEIYFDSKLNIDPQRICWKRCEDLNDRGLREIDIKIKEDINYNTGFNITAASDLMALFCLVNDKKEFKKKLSQTIVAFSKTNKPITISMLKIENAILAILEDALLPNVAFTKYQSPMIIHGGPFANIAHGCNSIIATNTALGLGDYVFTECGFGSELGFEKFMNIKMQTANMKPDGVIICATIKALMYHGQDDKDNIASLEKGFKNLLAHVEHVKQYGYEPLVVLNVNETDTTEELNRFMELCKKYNFNATQSNIYNAGPEKDTKVLTDKVVELASHENDVRYLYDVNKDSLRNKLDNITTFAYGANGYKVDKKVSAVLDNRDLQDYYICVSKTQYSLSSDPTKLNKPQNFYIEISDVAINYAAKMVVLICGNVFRMPGLNKEPRAKKFKI